MADELNISYGSTQHILVNVLDMNSVNVRLEPKDPNLVQKRRRVKVAKKLFDNIAEEPTFIKRINTDDESWVYEYDFKTVQQYSEWSS